MHIVEKNVALDNRKAGGGCTFYRGPGSLGMTKHSFLA